MGSGGVGKVGSTQSGILPLGPKNAADPSPPFFLFSQSAITVQFIQGIFIKKVRNKAITLLGFFFKPKGHNG